MDGSWLIFAACLGGIVLGVITVLLVMRSPTNDDRWEDEDPRAALTISPEIHFKLELASAIQFSDMDLLNWIRGLNRTPAYRPLIRRHISSVVAVMLRMREPLLMAAAMKEVWNHLGPDEAHRCASVVLQRVLPKDSRLAAATISTIALSPRLSEGDRMRLQELAATWGGRAVQGCG